MTRTSFYLLLLTAGMTFAVTTRAQTTDPARIVRDVQRTLDALTSFRSSYEETNHRSTDGRTVTRKGKLYLSPPNRLRLEESDKTVVVDGATAWVYLPKYNQVQISSITPDSDQYPTPKRIFDKYTSNRTPKNAGTAVVQGHECDVLSFPGVDGGATVTVWVDRARKLPLVTRQVSTEGDTLLYTLVDPVLNGKLDASLFTFTPPSGAEIVDLRD